MTSPTPWKANAQALEHHSEQPTDGLPMSAREECKYWNSEDDDERCNLLDEVRRLQLSC